METYEPLKPREIQRDDACRDHGVSYSTAKYRLNAGYSVEQVLGLI